jgi:hypothetical protein
MRHTILALCAMCAISANAQSSGKIVGHVTDSTFNAPLSGVTIFVEGTKKGAVSRPDGTYAITVASGVYSVRARYVGFQEMRYQGIRVGHDSVTRLDIVLSAADLSLDTVVVVASAHRGSQASVLTESRNSAALVDGIASEQMRVAPDATAGDAIRRVTGISINDSKFVSVRGIGERYNVAQINRASLTSTDPDRKAFAFDLIPSNLIDNLTVSKSFTPDQPGSFSGGLVQITTVSFPETFSGNVSVGGSFNSIATANTFLRYSGGASDMLGFDDGTRALPAGFPDKPLGMLNLSPDQRRTYGLSFANNWMTRQASAPLNASLSMNLGDAVTLFGNEFGYIAALSYRATAKHNDMVRSDFNLDGTPIFERVGTISFRNIFTQTGDDDVISLTGQDYDHTQDDRLTSFHYTQRSVYSGQLTGDHVFQDILGMKASWRLDLTASQSTEPDYRRNRYVRELGTSDPYYASIADAADPTSGGRFYSWLHERVVEGGLDLTLPLRGVSLKGGALLNTRTRDFSARVLAYRLRGADYTILYSAIDTLFAPSHIGPKAFELDEITNPSDTYDGAEHVSAGYAMADIPTEFGIGPVRVVAGLRVEHSTQQLNSGILGGGTVKYDRQHTDYLPALGFTWNPTAPLSVRLSASQTVSRPEFREIAPFAFYDFAIGTLVQGNPSIDRVVTQNIDAGVEYAPSAGETMAGRVFARRFDGAIEETDQGSNSVRSWANAQSPAMLYGMELEVRKSLQFIGGLFSGLLATANLAVIHSRVNVHDLTHGQQEDRPMQGQAPYILNVSLQYVSPVTGTSINVLYNRAGARLSTVNPYTGDTYEQPRDIIDLSISHPISDRFEMTYKAQDILAHVQEFTSNGRLVRSNERGVTHALSIATRF